MATATQQDRLIQLLRDHPLARARDIKAAGIDAPTIARAVKAGVVVRAGRGLYQLPDSDMDLETTLAEASIQIPKGVICMISALAYHGLSDQMPRKVWMAIGAKDWDPSVDYPPLRIVRFRSPYLEYGVERLIYRLSISKHRESFVLKGGMLVTLWTGDENRVTRDADFLGFGDASEDHLTSVFSQIMSEPADDGLVYEVDRLTAEAIREDQQYGGIRLRTVAHLGKTRIPITVDIGFGDAMIAPNYAVEYPSLLDMPAGHIRAYPPASVVAG